MEESEARWFHFTAKGHPNVRATHRTTIEITKDDYLTPRGDCIVGIAAEASAEDLPRWLKDGIRAGKPVIVVLCADGVCDSVTGWGSEDLTLEDGRRIVIRRSRYAEPSTLMIRSSKAAKDLSRELIGRLAAGALLDIYVALLPYIPQKNIL